MTTTWNDSYFVVLFPVDLWHGELLRGTAETIDAGFFADHAAPTPLSATVAETLADLAAFEATGRLVLK